MTYEEIREKLSSYILDITTKYIEELFQEHRGVHNFSYPTLLSYFYFQEALRSDKKPLFLECGVVLLPSPQGRYKTYCYKSPEVSIDKFRYQQLLEFLQTLGPIYSIDQIPFLKKEIKFVEIGYDLDKVFDAQSYPNAKKRHRVLVYPFKCFEKSKVIVEELTERSFSSVENLHNEWCRRKMEDPSTFRIMFPNKRYLKCCEIALKDKINFKTYIFFIADEVKAVRILGLAGDLVVDLANFGKTWSMESNMMNYLDVYVLRDLYNKGYKHFNCGAALNPKLKMFKCHLPYHEVISYTHPLSRII